MFLSFDLFIQRLAQIVAHILGCGSRRGEIAHALVFVVHMRRDYSARIIYYRAAAVFVERRRRVLAFAALRAAVDSDKEKAAQYVNLLYNQALIIAGIPLEDPAAYTELVCSLMK